MAKRNAQVSVEYVVLTAFLLLVTGIFFGFALFFFNENSATAHAQDAVITFVNEADRAASYGDGSKVFFTVYVPFDVQSLSAGRKTISMVISNAGGSMDVIGYTKANITPAAFNPASGRRSFSAEFIDGNVLVEELA
ncbi:MAG: hypothetical protein AABW99_03290 [archaeon]